MSKATIYQITGSYVKLHQTYQFTKHVKALTLEDALEKVYCEVGSNRVIRRKINIKETKEIPLRKI